MTTALIASLTATLVACFVVLQISAPSHPPVSPNSYANGLHTGP